MGNVVSFTGENKQIRDMFYGYDIPEPTQGALYRYIKHGLQPGSFLTAVLCNDLFTAIGRADEENEMAIAQICKWIYNEMPASAWGNKEATDNWMSKVRETNECEV